jgi:hypothetical protein
MKPSATEVANVIHELATEFRKQFGDKLKIEKGKYDELSASQLLHELAVEARKLLQSANKE